MIAVHFQTITPQQGSFNSCGRINTCNAAGTIFTDTQSKVRLQYMLHHEIMNGNHGFYIKLNNTRKFYLLQKWNALPMNQCTTFHLLYICAQSTKFLGSWL
jgi:hypothetical protein